jgi:hypothetical protein
MRSSGLRPIRDRLFVSGAPDSSTLALDDRRHGREAMR